MGQLPTGSIVLIEDTEQAERVEVKDPRNLAYITQTTLSVDDTQEIISVLKRRFSEINGPKQEDICYATTNRQQAVKAIAERCDALLVVGSPNSSNSARLVEVAHKLGCSKAMLVQGAAALNWHDLADIECLGITAGASAPEILVEEVIAACHERYEVTIEEITVTEEHVQFKLPRVLSQAAATA